MQSSTMGSLYLDLSCHFRNNHVIHLQIHSLLIAIIALFLAWLLKCKVDTLVFPDK